MIDLLFILLMQAASGDPAQIPATEPAAAEQTAPAEQPRTIRRDQVVVLVPDERAYEGVQCERTTTTGSRVRRETVCTTRASRTDARETAEWIANSSGSASRVGGR